VRRQSRLFAIAEYLRGRRTGVIAEDLAERFGVTIRTIYRDLDALRDAALPVRADRGRGGGYALEKSYSLPPVNFTAREAALLITIGRWASELRLVPFAETLAAALDKVRAALSASAQRELAEVAANLMFIGVPARSAPAPIRAAVEQAWFERQPLRITYVDSGSVESERLVRIVSVLMDRGHTFLDCNDLTNEGPRRFRLDRIVAATVATLDA
jgi:predicted DNA-binding transcriptional regulator YafY